MIASRRMLDVMWTLCQERSKGQAVQVEATARALWNIMYSSWQGSGEFCRAVLQ